MIFEMLMDTCTGPMARTVRDIAIMLDVMAGFDPKDPYTTTAAIAGKPRGGSYAANLGARDISQARIGVLGSGFGPDSDPDCKSVNQVIRKTLQVLRHAGTRLFDVDIPNKDRYIMESETYTVRSRADINRFLASRGRGRKIEQIVADKQYHPSLDLLEAVAEGPQDPLLDHHLGYAKRMETQMEFQRLVMGVLASHDLDAIVFPDSRIPAPLIDDVLAQRWLAMDFPINTLIASQARLPAVTLPVGFTEGGLPVGLEFVGLLYKEQMLLELAFAVESLTKARRAPNLAAITYS